VDKQPNATRLAARAGHSRLLKFLLMMISMATVIDSTAYGETPTGADLHVAGISSMSEKTVLRDLFDRCERVWHEGQYDVIPTCIGPTHIRHDEAGDRTVTREAYAAEIATIRQERPDIRVVVYDHSFKGDRA
jgi:hypothetical protein